MLTFLAYLGLERRRLERALRRVPLRIAVGGTRGKSGVARLIAAGLRESGLRVLAKTTGSEPAVIYPDGSEDKLARPGAPSIREQVRVLGLAAGAGAQALVAELMSIGGECLSVESREIVRPGLLALTNVRLDHLEAMGGTKERIARTLAAAFPEDGTVFLPAEEDRPVFAKTAARLRTRLVLVDKITGSAADLPASEFEPNLRLALAVLESLGVDRATALRGVSRARPDFGSLKIWKGTFGTSSRAVYCVSAFAANDPESSAAALARARELLPPAAGPFVGLLCLREDRGDRTLQWVRAAGEGFFDAFESVAVVGGPAMAVRRKLGRALGAGLAKFSFEPDPEPGALMSRIVPSAEAGEGELVVAGLGNIVGHGERFVRYWNEVGSPHGR